MAERINKIARSRGERRHRKARGHPTNALPRASTNNTPPACVRLPRTSPLSTLECHGLSRAVQWRVSRKKNQVSFGPSGRFRLGARRFSPRSMSIHARRDGLFRAFASDSIPIQLPYSRPIITKKMDSASRRISRVSRAVSLACAPAQRHSRLTRSTRSSTNTRGRLSSVSNARWRLLT
jgi:hypothetical protein